MMKGWVISFPRSFKGFIYLFIFAFLLYSFFPFPTWCYFGQEASGTVSMLLHWWEEQLNKQDQIAQADREWAVAMVTSLTSLLPVNPDPSYEVPANSWSRKTWETTDVYVHHNPDGIGAFMSSKNRKKISPRCQCTPISRKLPAEVYRKVCHL